MTHLIHLTNGQKNQLDFDHPLLSGAVEISDDDLPDLISRHLDGDQQATDDLILGNLFLVKWVVGRYLYNWPSSKPYVDDMCSDGMLSVVQVVNNLQSADVAIRPIIVNHVKLNIETLLNDIRYQVNASLSTNFRRLRDGKPLETHTNASEDSVNRPSGYMNMPNDLVCSYDDTPDYIDALDSLQYLQGLDHEEMVDAVLSIIEMNHNLLECDLTDAERTLLSKLTELRTEDA